MAILDDQWIKIKKEDIKSGLIVAFQIVEPGAITHVGITLQFGIFLHTLQKKNSCIEGLKKYQNLIEGYYAYRA